MQFMVKIFASTFKKIRNINSLIMYAKGKAILKFEIEQRKNYLSVRVNLFIFHVFYVGNYLLKKFWTTWSVSAAVFRTAFVY